MNKEDLKQFKVTYWVKVQDGLGKGHTLRSFRRTRTVKALKKSEAKKKTRIWLHKKYRVRDYKVTAKEVKN